MAQDKSKKKQPDAKPDDDDDDDAGDDTPLTRGEVMKLINGAVSGQLSRKLPAAIEAGVSPIMAKLDELGGGKKKPDDSDDDDAEDDEDQAPSKKGKGRADPVVTKMSKQLTNLQQQIKDRDDKLAKEAEARKASKIESELTKALTELGVDKNRIRGALAIHKGAASVDDESGNVLFKVKRDGYDEDLEPGAALKEWAGTEEGKSYLAPTGSSGGAGARAPRQQGPARKPAPNTPEAKAEKVQNAKNDLLGAVGQLVAGGSIAIE
jgi:hypothetical protein